MDGDGGEQEHEGAVKKQRRGVIPALFLFITLYSSSASNPAAVSCGGKALGAGTSSIRGGGGS